MSAKTELQINFRGVDKTASVVRGIGNSINSFALKAAASLAGIFAVRAIAGGVKELISSFDALGDRAQQIGVSAETFQRMGNALEQVGLKSEQAGQLLGFMKKNIGKEADTKDNIFSRMGMDAQALKAMNPEQQFLEIGKTIASMGNETDRVTALTKIFGRTGGDLAPLLRKGPEAFVEGLQGVMGMVDVVSNKNVEKMGQMNDAFAAVGAAAKTDMANAFLSIMSNGEESFGRVDVAIFALYQKVKLFALTAVSAFGWIKDAVEAIFTEKTFEGMTSWKERTQKDLAETTDALEKYKAGVNAKDQLASGFKDATDGAVTLQSKLGQVRDSIRNFGKMELAGTYATIQSKFGGMMPAIGGGMRENKGNVNNFGVMENLLKKIADNTSDTADQLEGLDEI